MSDTKNEELEAEAPEGEAEVSSVRQPTVSASKAADDASPVIGEGDEDEETWTNQPGSAGDAEGESLDEELEGEDDDLVEDDEDDQAPVVRKQIQNGRDVLCEELPVRAQRAKLRMRPHLTGAFVIELANSGERFLFDWRSEEATVSPFKGEVIVAADSTDPARVDSLIAISEQNLMAVRSGDLNPQVAMLAEKIKVKGKMAPAVYLFNLIAPRMRQ